MTAASRQKGAFVRGSLGVLAMLFVQRPWSILESAPSLGQQIAVVGKLDKLLDKSLIAENNRAPLETECHGIN